MPDPVSRFEHWNNLARGQVQLGMMGFFRLIRRDRFRVGDFQVDLLAVPIPGLPPAFEGYRLVQITDLHVGHWLSLDRLSGVVDLVNAQQPDCVVMTGDFVSYVVEQVSGGMVASLRRLDAPDGVLAILGNHDHWMGAERVANILQQAGVVVLRNQFVSLQRQAAEEAPPDRLLIAGLDDIVVGAARSAGIAGPAPRRAARHPAGARAGFRRPGGRHRALCPAAFRPLPRRPDRNTLRACAGARPDVQEISQRHVPGGGDAAVHQPRRRHACAARAG